MKLSPQTLVLIADGRKMLFLRQDVGGLTLEDKRTQDNPATRDQGSDRPGSTSAGGGQRSSFSETDFHQLEEDRFAASAGELLNARALAHEFKHVVVIAPPRTLGELRKHYRKEVSDRLVGEIDKDLTGHALSDIEKIIEAA